MILLALDGIAEAIGQLLRFALMIVWQVIKWPLHLLLECLFGLFDIGLRRLTDEPVQEIERNHEHDQPRGPSFPSPEQRKPNT
ncbi:hypothetical protein [Blastopirellula retiformator]|uniref:Uncharacterized protein n=1 Tax=Blastopirellula retiformator TaxID=2527970 RepID=A0A5C5UXF9_9BACT|nr:hypothetical protein [Blastopirellula retiformator]TWT30095.1 hypothetical protein Enr8_47520 [Blastopirellula retiformator]